MLLKLAHAFSFFIRHIGHPTVVRENIEVFTFVTASWTEIISALPKHRNPEWSQDCEAMRSTRQDNNQLVMTIKTLLGPWNDSVYEIPPKRALLQAYYTQGLNHGWYSILYLHNIYDLVYGLFTRSSATH